DAECTRASFDNPYTKWSDSDPRLLADALCEVVEAPERAETAAKAASSVGPLSWDLVADQLEAGLRRGLRLAVASAPTRWPPAFLGPGGREGSRAGRREGRGARGGPRPRWAGARSSGGAPPPSPPVRRHSGPATPNITKNTPMSMLKLIMSAVEK